MTADIEDWFGQVNIDNNYFKREITNQNSDVMAIFIKIVTLTPPRCEAASKALKECKECASIFSEFFFDRFGII